MNVDFFFLLSEGNRTLFAVYSILLSSPRDRWCCAFTLFFLCNGVSFQSVENRVLTNDKQLSGFALLSGFVWNYTFTVGTGVRSWDLVHYSSVIHCWEQRSPVDWYCAAQKRNEIHFLFLAQVNNKLSWPCNNSELLQSNTIMTLHWMKSHLSHQAMWHFTELFMWCLLFLYRTRVPDVMKIHLVI